MKAKELTKMLSEAMWSDKIKTSWHPTPGFFTKSAEAITSGLKSNSKDLKTSMARLNFFINRAGDTLSSDRKAELEKAKVILDKLYNKKD